MSKFIMKDKIEFSDDEKEFDKYCKLKGEYLHKQIYDLLFEKSEIVKYTDLSSIIRYDKSLRNILYIYLATFEEYLKAEIFRRYDVFDCNKIYNGKNVDDLIKDVYDNKNHQNSNLYYCFELELGPIIRFIENKQMFENSYINKLKKVKKLRNHVMHHNLLICGKAKNMNEFINNKKELKDEITLLKELLPNDYQKGFVKDVNDLKCDVADFKIVLE